MKLLSQILALGCATASIASANDALIYTFDTSPRVSTPKNRLIPPRDADLLLSKRLGSSSQISLGEVDDALLDNLNTFSGCVSQLFGNVESTPRFLVEIRGDWDLIKGTAATS